MLNELNQGMWIGSSVHTHAGKCNCGRHHDDSRSPIRSLNAVMDGGRSLLSAAHASTRVSRRRSRRTESMPRGMRSSHVSLAAAAVRRQWQRVFPTFSFFDGPAINEHTEPSRRKACSIHRGRKKREWHQTMRGRTRMKRWCPVEQEKQHRYRSIEVAGGIDGHGIIKLLWRHVVPCTTAAPALQGNGTT